MTWPILLALVATVTVAAALQASTGIGFGMLAAPVAVMLEPALVPGPLLLLSLLLSVMTALRERHAIDLPGLSFATVGRVFGAAAAGATLALVPASAFPAIFSLLILAAVALSASGWHARPTRNNLVAAGLASGYMGTITSVGAPPMALVYQNASGPMIRSTMGAFFVLGSTISLAALIAVDRAPVLELLRSLWLLFPVWLGFRLSRHAIGYIDRGRVRPFVLGLSAASALVLLLREALS